jgi:hypothetical protein
LDSSGSGVEHAGQTLMQALQVQVSAHKSQAHKLVGCNKAFITENVPRVRCLGGDGFVECGSRSANMSFEILRQLVGHAYKLDSLALSYPCYNSCYSRQHMYVLVSIKIHWCCTGQLLEDGYLCFHLSADLFEADFTSSQRLPQAAFSAHVKHLFVPSVYVCIVSSPHLPVC